MTLVRKSLEEQRVKYANLIFNIAYTVFVLKAFYSFTEIMPHYAEKLIFNICNLTVLGLCAYKMLFLQKYSIKRIFFCIFFAIAAYYTDKQIYSFLFLPAFFLLASTQDVDYRNTVRFMYRIQAVIIAVHALLYPLYYKFMPYAIGFTYRNGDRSQARHQFLLQHANIFSMLLLWTLIGYIYVNFEKLDKLKLIIVWLIYAFFYRFTDSNSGMLILSAIVIILFLRDLYPKRIERIVDFLSRYLFIILSVFYTIMMVSFPKLSGGARDAWKAIDSFFTGRLKYGAYVYNKVGFTLFGQHLPFVSKEYWHGFWIDGIATDCTYMFFGIYYGIIYIFLISFLFWKFSKRARFEEKVIIVAYSLYTMMELYVTYVYFCFALFVIMQYVWKENDPKRVNNENDKESVDHNSCLQSGKIS